VKRYVTEPGTASLDHIFERAATRQLQIVFSAWNVGETIGVIDQRRQRGQMTASEFSSALFNFSDETLRTVRQGNLQLVPLAGSILTDAWRILMEEHIYSADALQIATCKSERCEVFASADRNLLQAAENQGLSAEDPVKDEKKMKAL
jgi:predicted nucleic acid-binding protein